MQSDWIVILPHLFLAGGGLLIFCIGAFWKNRPDGTLFITALLSAGAAAVEALAFSGSGTPFAGMVSGDSFSRFFIALFCGISVITLLFSRRYALHRRFSGDEFYGLILFATLGMALAAGATHWAILFLGVELLSISLYILIAIHKSSQAANEAGIKYFIMGSAASAILLFGIAILYASTGEMGIVESLNAPDSRNPLFLLGLGMVITGFGFKISWVPFHLWTPDVYQGAPAPVAGFLSTGSKIAMVAALLRIVTGASPPVWEVIAPVIWTLAALTIIVGNLTALVQDHIKRLLAYSSIAQMGYLLMALLASRGDGAGASAVIFYSVIYAFMDLGAFGAVSLVSLGEPMARADRDSLTAYRGLGYEYPFAGALLAVSLLSLAGLPPTGGFIGKFALFQAAIGADYMAIAVIGIIGAIISIYYYIKVIAVLYMRPTRVPTPHTFPGFSGPVACASIFALIVLMGILPGSLLEVIAVILS